jgi:hypothetical protein
VPTAALVSPQSCARQPAFDAKAVELLGENVSSSANFVPFRCGLLTIVPKGFTSSIKGESIMKKLSNDDKFSFSELAVVGNMSKRSIQHLADAKLLPDSSEIARLKRVAVVGAMLGAGVPLFAAARVAEAILTYFNTEDGEAPSGFKYLANELPSEEQLRLPHGDRINDFWYHDALKRYPAIYPLGQARIGDAQIEIVDKSLVFLSYLGVKTIIKVFGDESEESSYVGSIQGWARGAESKVRLLEMDASFDPEDPDFPRKGREVTISVNDRRKNAIAIVKINASLAIRTGLDRLAGHRQ